MDTKSIAMDTGLKSLVTIVRFHRLPAESEKIAHQYCLSGEDFDGTRILQVTKTHSQSKKISSYTLHSMGNAILPVIVKAKDGN